MKRKLNKENTKTETPKTEFIHITCNDIVAIGFVIEHCAVRIHDASRVDKTNIYIYIYIHMSISIYIQRERETERGRERERDVDSRACEAFLVVMIQGQTYAYMAVALEKWIGVQLFLHMDTSSSARE